jgi:hypothetical protein
VYNGIKRNKEQAMNTRNLRILIKTTTKLKQILRIKELKDGSILYSFPPLDGRSESRLYAEYESVVPTEGGDMRYKYEDGILIFEGVDHMTLHTSGYHVITSPPASGHSQHWGEIVQPRLDVQFEWRPFGLIIPADLDRFPDYFHEINPNSDTQINLNKPGLDWVYFRLNIIGKRLEQGKPFSITVPSSEINLSSPDIEKLFKGGISWFLLPLKSYTLCFILGTFSDKPRPPRTIFARWELKANGKLHIAYFE